MHVGGGLLVRMGVRGLNGRSVQRRTHLRPQVTRRGMRRAFSRLGVTGRVPSAMQQKPDRRQKRKDGGYPLKCVAQTHMAITLAHLN